MKAKQTLSLDVQKMFLNYAHYVQIIQRLSIFDNMITRSTQQTCMFSNMAKAHLTFHLGKKSGSLKILTLRFRSAWLVLKCSNKWAILEYFHGETFEVALADLRDVSSFPKWTEAPKCLSFRSPPQDCCHGTQLQANLKGDVYCLKQLTPLANITNFHTRSQNQLC